jgi:hypothetical protein
MNLVRRPAGLTSALTVAFTLLFSLLHTLPYYPLTPSVAEAATVSDWQVRTVSLSADRMMYMGDPIAYRQTGASALGWSKTGEPLLYVSATGAGSDYLYRFRLGETVPSAAYPFPGGGGQLWSMVALENGDVYFTCNGNLFKYSADQDRVISLGKPHAQTTMIWQLAVAPDGIVYGATYPKARIFQVDPKNDRITDLGPVADLEYARSIAVSERYVFVGTGPLLDLIAYDRQTGETRCILPEDMRLINGFISNLAVRGNRLFAPAGNDTSVALVFDTDTLQQVQKVFGFSFPVSPVDEENQVWFGLKRTTPYVYDLNRDSYRQSGWVMPTANSLGWAQLPESAIPEARRSLFKGVSLIGFSAEEYWALDPQSKQVLNIPVEIPAAPARINSLSASAGKVYGGAFSPGGLFIYDIQTNQTITTPQFGQTDSLVLYDGKLYFGTYTGAQLKMYHLEQAQAESLGPVGYDQDRVVVMIEHRRKIIAGTVPDYGLQGGALAVINPADHKVRSFHNVVPNHSIVSLAGYENWVFGGTSTQGGLGKAPVEGDAYLFAWDVTTEKLAWSIQPLNEPAIGALITGADGLLWGAGTHSIFAVDPATREIVLTQQVLSAGTPSYSIREAYSAGYNQYVVFTINHSVLIIIDTAQHTIKLLPGNFNRCAIGDDGALYFTRTTELMRIAPEVWMNL